MLFVARYFFRRTASLTDGFIEGCACGVSTNNGEGPFFVTVAVQLPVIHRSLARGLEAVIFAACRSCRFSASTPTGDSSSKDTLFSRSLEGRRRGLSRLSPSRFTPSRLSRFVAVAPVAVAPPPPSPLPVRAVAPAAPFLPFHFQGVVELLRRGVRGAALEARGKAAVAKQPLHVFLGGGSPRARF